MPDEVPPEATEHSRVVDEQPRIGISGNSTEFPSSTVFDYWATRGSRINFTKWPNWALVSRPLLAQTA